MDKNWYTNESVWSLSTFYPDLLEDLKYMNVVRWYKVYQVEYLVVVSYWYCSVFSIEQMGIQWDDRDALRSNEHNDNHN